MHTKNLFFIGLVAVSFVPYAYSMDSKEIVLTPATKNHFYEKWFGLIKALGVTQEKYREVDLEEGMAGITKQIYLEGGLEGLLKNKKARATALDFHNAIKKSPAFQAAVKQLLEAASTADVKKKKVAGLGVIAAYRTESLKEMYKRDYPTKVPEGYELAFDMQTKLPWKDMNYLADMYKVNIHMSVEKHLPFARAVSLAQLLAWQEFSSLLTFKE